MGYDFKKAVGVKLSERGQKLTDGVYSLKVIRNKTIKSREGLDLWIAEWEVTASNNPAHPVGSQRNWSVNISDADQGFKNIKAYVYAALGYTYSNPADKAEIDANIEPKIDQVLASTLEDPTDPACTNSLAGEEFHAEVKGSKTKAGFDFMKHTFSPKAAA